MIKLVRRYPDSKPEDITDAFSRGVICGMAVWRGTCNDVQIYLGQDGVYHASPNCGSKVVGDASVD